MKYGLMEALPQLMASPSPRRAWIEIFLLMLFSAYVPRRPPHGGRGLKYVILYDIVVLDKSPSPRRAWIEMTTPRAPTAAGGSPSPRRAQSETGGYIKYIRKHDNCLFIVLEQRFLNIETAPCSQIQDAAIIGLQYSKTSMLYARQLTIYIPCLRSSIFCA